jgi:hypothetical protein
MSISSIKITALNNIGNSIAYTTLVPLVDMTGTPTTKKANLQIVGNLILSGAGGSYFVAAAQAINAQTVSNAAQPAITSVGTLTGLTVSGVSNLGPVGNVRITGGTAGYVLSTNGSGILSWAVPGSGATGTSGFSGISGFSGFSGFSGTSGFSGRSGFSGITGATGLPGNVTPISVTYSELYTLWDSGDLSPGNHYLITNYQTIYDQPDFYANGLPKTTVTTLTGTTEPIIVFATTTDTLDLHAYSTIYPEDVIEYDISFTSTEIMAAPSKGRIIFRTDSNNNSTGYDGRAVLLKRYESSPSSGVFNTYVDNGGASQANIPTFGAGAHDINTGRYTPPTSGYFLISNNIFYNGCFDIIASGEFYNNTFGDGSGIGLYESIFGYNCRNNVILSGYNNNIANAFFSNIIGDDFRNNHIQNGFRLNNIGNSFTSNSILSGFRENVISDGFANNQIGYDFRNPGITIGIGFVNNVIGNDFANNIEIGDDFSDNHIGDNFSANDIANDFSGWNLQNNFTGNTIGNANPAYTVIESLSTTSGTIIKATGGYLQATQTLVEGGFGNTANLTVTTGNTYPWVFRADGNLVLPGNTIAINFANGSAAFGNLVQWTTAPVANTSTGTTGQAAYDAGGNLYICVSANNWAKFTGTTSW